MGIEGIRRLVITPVKEIVDKIPGGRSMGKTKVQIVKEDPGICEKRGGHVVVADGVSFCTYVENKKGTPITDAEVEYLGRGKAAVKRPGQPDEIIDVPR